MTLTLQSLRKAMDLLDEFPPVAVEVQVSSLIREQIDRMEKALPVHSVGSLFGMKLVENPALPAGSWLEVFSDGSIKFHKERTED